MRKALTTLRRRYEREDGSLLMDVLIGLFILGIVLAIVLPQYLSSKDKGIDGSMKSDLHVASVSLEALKTNNGGTIPGSAAVAATPTAVSSVTIDGETLHGDQNNLLQTFKDTTSDVCIVVTRATGAAPGSNSWMYKDGTITAGSACGTGYTAF